MAEEYLKLGFYIGVGGVVTFDNAKKLKEAVEFLPMDKILLETDSPYLTPVSYTHLDVYKRQYFIKSIQVFLTSLFMYSNDAVNSKFLKFHGK